MNIEAYNLDSLRKLVRALQRENESLKELLTENHRHLAGSLQISL